MEEDELQRLYTWIDEVPLSRAKKNITRDFSDGVLVAEIVHHFIPRFVDLHNYTPALSKPQKEGNWETLQRKVFKRIGLEVTRNVVQGVIECHPGVVEVVLSNLRVKIEQYLLKKSGHGQDNSDDYEVRAHENYLSDSYSGEAGEALMQKDQVIIDLQETVDILQVKISKLQQLLKLKDKRIEELTDKLKTKSSSSGKARNHR
eukprot:m.41187 g.41187  ORF g.41187 m.41187 type:complete len:203 (-) comp11437_c0_seq3:131-739(-)